MQRRLKPSVIVALISIVAIVVAIAIYFTMTASDIHFVGDKSVEVKCESVDYYKFVESVDKGKISDLEIDSSAVDLNKLGSYEVIYKLNDESRTLKLEVVDTIAPEFEISDKQIALNEDVNPEDLVKNINDATETTVSLKKNTKFNKEGKVEVEIVVEDEGGNQTSKTATYDIKKDTQAPKIEIVSENALLGSNKELKDFIEVSDDYDLRPQIDVSDGGFDINKKGEYDVKYVVTDFSGNQSEKTFTIKVVDKTPSEDKVVYLTFDDGPSKYTKDVLDILDEYDVKATFFITGMNPKYRDNIKLAHDKGHTIGLHTYSHDYKKVYSSVDSYYKDLEEVGELAKEYIGFVPKYIRFPGGGSNTVSRKYSKGIMSTLSKDVQKKGYEYYDWNCDNGDGYSKITKNEMLKRAKSAPYNHVMILMHDANGKQDTVDTLPEIIKYYKDKGYRFEAITEATFVPHQRVNN